VEIRHFRMMQHSPFAVATFYERFMTVAFLICGGDVTAKPDGKEKAIFPGQAPSAMGRCSVY
jgi:hypothetical protein